MILVPFDPESPVYGGLDLSATTDLTAWAMVQPLDPAGFAVNWRFWIPRNRADAAERRDRIPYKRWADEEFLTLTDGDVVDYSIVESQIAADCEAFGVIHVGYDPWNAEATRQRLESAGVDMLKVMQTYRDLSESCKALEAAVLSKTLRHGGNPIAEWMAENVEVETDNNGNIRPCKPKHGSMKRIDGISALVTAIAVSINSAGTGILDYYDNHDLEVI